MTAREIAANRHGKRSQLNGLRRIWVNRDPIATSALRPFIPQFQT